MDYFYWAGAYPDLGTRNDELADHLHGPTPKRGVFGLTGADYRTSTNFAALWLHRITASPNPDPAVQARARAIVDGWGCHIAADWVAHSWLPLVLDSDPSKDAGDTLHAVAEFEVDLCLAYTEGFLPAQPLVLKVDPNELRAMVLNHALADYAASKGGASTWPSFRARWDGYPLFDSAIEARTLGLFPGWMSTYSVLIRRTLDVASRLNPDALTDLEALGETVRPMLDQSRSLCADWLANPWAEGIPDGIDVEPLYDPTLPPPPGAIDPTPPLPGTLRTRVAELLDTLTELAVSAGVLRLECTETSEPGVFEYTAVVPDEAVLEEFVATTLSELATTPAAVASDQSQNPEGAADLSEGAHLLANVFDRIVNHRDEKLRGLSLWLWI